MSGLVRARLGLQARMLFTPIRGGGHVAGGEIFTAAVPNKKRKAEQAERAERAEKKLTKPEKAEQVRHTRVRAHAHVHMLDQ